MIKDLVVLENFYTTKSVPQLSKIEPKMSKTISQVEKITTQIAFCTFGTFSYLLVYFLGKEFNIVYQACQTGGPRAACGPIACSVRPGVTFFDLNN